MLVGRASEVDGRWHQHMTGFTGLLSAVFAALTAIFLPTRL